MNLRRTLNVNNKQYDYFSIKAAQDAGFKNLSKLPYSMKILLENLLRHLDGHTVQKDDIKAFESWITTKQSDREIAYRPARVLMQDFTGVPAIVDLAAMRVAMEKLGGNAEKINPLISVDLVIDHSVQVDEFGTPKAFEDNVHIEMERNLERYQFLRWGQKAFANFRVVPPGTGICHQVNLEYLARVVWTLDKDGRTLAYPDTVVGTDSHTTMINGLGILGWGVGGIEAEAAMLDQPISMLIPEVIGVKLTGHLKEGIIATDLVLTITQILRKRGVVGKFVEFFGPGLKDLPLADRATISNMAPEYGATCGYFPIDDETLRYMELTGRDQDLIALTRAYAKEQGLWHDPHSPDPIYTDILELNLSDIEPSLAGPKRPQDRVNLSSIRGAFDQALAQAGKSNEINLAVPAEAEGGDYALHHGDVVIAAITSCTNTSNPSALIAAGLIAKKAIKLGLHNKPWVKSSLAPDSKVVTDYLNKAGLQTYLDQLGYNLVGYGCTTCIGNSGPLPDPVSKAIDAADLVVSSVLSGNRNFEGRVHPQVQANWLASPPLVVIFGLAGTTRIDLNHEPVTHDPKGNPVYLKDLWPSNAEILKEVSRVVSRDMFIEQYRNTFMGDSVWQSISINEDKTYQWQPQSTYVKHPPYFEGLTKQLPPIKPIKQARILALLGDSVTTDHISPAGSIKSSSPAGRYLTELGVAVKDFNSYGTRRGNHEVMMRGTFANIRIRNEMLPGVEGGFTRHIPSGEQLSIFDAAMRYQAEKTPLVVIAGKEYGTGSSRDWAAKGPRLQGVLAVIAESFERIHRSNLIGMGILPFQFIDGTTRKTLNLTGEETIDLLGIDEKISPNMIIQAHFTRADGTSFKCPLLCRIDTADEVDYYKNGGILHYVLRKMCKN